MSDAILEVVINKLVSLLREEVILLKDIHKEVEEIEHELSRVLSVLSNVEKRAETEGDTMSVGVKSWAQNLRQVAFQAEDGITEYTHHIAQQPHPDQRSSVECLQQIFCFLPFCYSSLKERRALARQIKKSKMRLIKVIEQGNTYGFLNSIQPVSTSTVSKKNDILYDPRREARYLQEDQLVGIEFARDEIVDLVLDKSCRRTVISVVGMGGLGKTTLAQQVYNHVKRKFHCHAWVQVTQTYNRVEILRTLIRELFESTKESVPSEIHTMDVERLIWELREYLKEKNYLVIFDDVWNEDFWGDIEHALVDDKGIGRIIITTRNIQIANSSRSFPSVYIHAMQCLPKEKARELFFKRAFKSEDRCPEELKAISSKIVERCKGLPLAIVAIAGLLSKKNKTIKEWKSFDASLSSELVDNDQLKSVRKILFLSYNDLPYHLKSCLLYFGMFPQRHSIRSGRLIRQWIADGFVKVVEGKTLEEVAQAYMNELIDRSLVEALDHDVTGKAKKCCVHDVLHEIIVKKTEEVSFLRVMSEITESKFKEITRRLSIMKNSSNDVLQRNKFPHTHSVVVFREDQTFNSIMSIFTKNFKFLKVLDFEDACQIDHLPEDIGNLFDLRYLSVRGTKVSKLPWSIEKLEKLETLDLKWSLVHEIPTNMINKLSKLRHLFGCNIQANAAFGYVGLKVVGGIGGLKDLQKLDYIEVDGDGGDNVFKELENLMQLRTLGIMKLRREDGALLCGCVEKMELLESLTVISKNKDEIIDLESISSPPQNLERLTLRGRLMNLPKWFTQLQSLVKIKLANSMLEDDPLQVLQKMHNLLHLDICYDAYVGAQLHFKKGAFSKLKKLYLYELNQLRSLVIEERALPMLEELYIGPCPQMNEVPLGLQHLQNLKILLFSRMPVKFMMLQEFSTLYHLPVIFSYINYNKQAELISLQDLLRWRSNWILRVKGTESEIERANTLESTTDEHETERASILPTTTGQDQDLAISEGVSTFGSILGEQEAEETFDNIALMEDQEEIKGPNTSGTTTPREDQEATDQASTFDATGQDQDSAKSGWGSTFCSLIGKQKIETASTSGTTTPREDQDTIERATTLTTTASQDQDYAMSEEVGTLGSMMGEQETEGASTSETATPRKDDKDATERASNFATTAGQDQDYAVAEEEGASTSCTWKKGKD